MAFLLGLLLAPFGACVGTLLVVAMVTAIEGFGPLGVNARFLFWFGIPIGSIYAAPTTLIVLPFAHFVFSARQGSLTRALAATGFASGAVTMIATILVTSRPEDDVIATRAIVLALIGGASGAACGAAWARLPPR